MKAIADTGFLVAFGNRKDHYHEWAVGIAEGVTEPLVTCEPCWPKPRFISVAAPWFWLLHDGLVGSTFVLSEHISRLAELADRKSDLADLCLIRLSELHLRYPMITTDLAHFRVYRRGRRETIPLIHPPVR